MLRPASNTTAWAIGKPGRNGFVVRRIVWGIALAREERRDDEEIRAAAIWVEDGWKRRHRMPREERYANP